MHALGRSLLRSLPPQPRADGGNVLLWMGVPRLLCLLTMLMPVAGLATQVTVSFRMQEEEQHESVAHTVVAQSALSEQRRQSVPRASLSRLRAQPALRAPRSSGVPPATVTGHRLACGICAPMLC